MKKYCICQNSKPLKRELITTKYTESGLKNITLVGVEHYRCDVCGEEFFGYHNMEQLHELIVSVLVRKKEMLTGAEAKFIRKHLGYSAPVLGQMLIYAHETIYRHEGAQDEPVSAQYDRLLRLLAATQKPDREYDLHDLVINEKWAEADQIRLAPTKTGSWKVAA